MFIVVKYGQNESLLCNPSCAVVNLLTSIKRRAGYGHTNMTLDLSDETGLIKELDDHKGESATSLLAGHNTYILLKKDPIPADDTTTQPNTAQTKFTYTALLEHIEDLFPDFRLHLAEMEKNKTRKAGSKTPSPAGRLLSKHPKKRTSSTRRK